MRLMHAVANIADKLADYLRFKPAPHGIEIQIHAPVLDEWLDMHFIYDGKRLPDWVCGLPEEYRRALLDGLIDASPLCYKPTCRFYMTDKRQAFEVKRLAESLGYAPSVHAGLPVDPACAEPFYSGVEPIYTIDLHAPFCHTDNASA